MTGTEALIVEDAMADPAVSKALQAGIDRANAHAASNAQKVQKWTVLREDFSVPGGELGPTLKMKRHVVLEKNQRAVDKFYS